MSYNPTPPRLAAALLRRVLPPGVAGESIKGDLDQEFAESASCSSPTRARAWYVLESLKFAVRYGRQGMGAWIGSQRGTAKRTGDSTMSVFRQELRYAVREPDELVGVWHTAPGLGYDEVNQSPALHYTYLDEGRSFSEIGMWDNGSASVTGLDEPEVVQIMQVTEGTFRALRIQPVLGRGFTAEDDSHDAALTVILSYDYWQTRFGGDAGVLGRTIDVESRPREIIGVLGADARFLSFDPAFYLPFQFDRSVLAVLDVGRMLPMGIERYPGGVTLQMMEQVRFGPNLRPLKNAVVGDVGEVLWVLLGTVGMILLIACANVANLFLVRAEGREKEMAVRTAMGAGRSRIAREFLLESLLLGVFGGLGGVALAFGGLELLRSLGPAELPRLAIV